MCKFINVRMCIQDIPTAGGVISKGKLFGEAQVTRSKDTGVSLSQGKLTVKEYTDYQVRAHHSNRQMLGKRPLPPQPPPHTHTQTHTRECMCQADLIGLSSAKVGTDVACGTFTARPAS